VQEPIIVRQYRTDAVGAVTFTVDVKNSSSRTYVPARTTIKAAFHYAN